MAAYSFTVGGVDYSRWSDVTQMFWSEGEVGAYFEAVIASGEVAGKTLTAGTDFTGQELYLRDLTNSRTLFGGYVDDMEVEHGVGPVVYYHLRAPDFDSLLDRQSIPKWRSAVSTGKTVRWMATDREMVQNAVSLIGYDLTASSSTVDSTNAAMPKITLTSITLRDLLQAIADAACDLTSAGQAIRRFYTDFDKKFHYFKTSEGTSAPYNVGDRVWNGTYIIPDYIKYTKNVTDAAKKVYVRGSNSNGSGWVNKSTSRQYDRVDIIDQPQSDSAAEKNAVGSAYLNREGAPVRGGMFIVTGYDGWRKGQTITVHDSAFGINEDFPIRDIQATPNFGNGVTTYEISFGALPWRGSYMLPRKKRSAAATGTPGNGGGGGGSGSGTGSDGLPPDNGSGSLNGGTWTQ